MATRIEGKRAVALPVPLPPRPAASSDQARNTAGFDSARIG